MWCVPLCLHGLWFGIPCEASARSREADSDQVRYRFNGLGRGVPSHLGCVLMQQGKVIALFLSLYAAGRDPGF